MIIYPSVKDNIVLIVENWDLSFIYNKKEIYSSKGKENVSYKVFKNDNLIIKEWKNVVIKCIFEKTLNGPILIRREKNIDNVLFNFYPRMPKK